MTGPVMREFTWKCVCGKWQTAHWPVRFEVTIPNSLAPRQQLSGVYLKANHPAFRAVPHDDVHCVCGRTLAASDEQLEYQRKRGSEMATELAVSGGE